LEPLVALEPKLLGIADLADNEVRQTELLAAGQLAAVTAHQIMVAKSLAVADDELDPVNALTNHTLQYLMKCLENLPNLQTS